MTLLYLGFLSLSVLIGALICFLIGVKKDFHNGWCVPGFLIGLLSLMCTIGFFVTHAETEAENQQMAAATAEQQGKDALLEGLAEDYNFHISDDLFSRLTTNLEPTQIQNGAGDGLAWFGTPVQAIINDEVYSIQLAWAGDEWMLLDLTDGQNSEVLPELVLAGEESNP